MDLPGFVAVCGSSLFGWWLLQTNSVKSLFFAMCGYCSLWWSATDWTRFPKCLEPVRFPVIAKRFRVCVSGCLHPSACWQLCLASISYLCRAPRSDRSESLEPFRPSLCMPEALGPYSFIHGHGPLAFQKYVGIFRSPLGHLSPQLFFLSLLSSLLSAQTFLSTTSGRLQN